MAEEKSRFNMSQLILFRINSMQEAAIRHYRAGNLKEWFFEWRNIKYQIIGKLNVDERVELKLLEGKIGKASGKDKLFAAIEEYMINIQDLIELKEIGLASKSDETIFA